MIMRALGLFTLLATSTLIQVPKAHAKESSSTLVVVSGGLAIGGQVRGENSSDDLDSGFGLGLTFASALHPNFNLGAHLGLLSWLSDGPDDRDRNSLFDLSLRPEGVFPINDKVQVFVAGMLGLSYSVIGENDISLGEIEPALGSHYGFALGGRFDLGEGKGLQIELALQTYEAEHEVDTFIGDIQIDSELEVAMLNLGFVFH
ncbi:MAG: hypothetical protein JKY56_14580 [Kofleriaceae bacterium]|nr:hypothetical protein [Kofleriaceae bacterium]